MIKGPFTSDGVDYYGEVHNNKTEFGELVTGYFETIDDSNSYITEQPTPSRVLTHKSCHPRVLCGV